MPRWKDAGWHKVPIIGQLALMAEAAQLDMWRYIKDVEDGRLQVLTNATPEGFHLSISHLVLDEDNTPAPGRYPTWTEILEAREFFTNPQVRFVMHLPTKEEYVNIHETTFHIWEAQA